MVCTAHRLQCKTLHYPKHKFHAYAHTIKYRGVSMWDPQRSILDREPINFSIESTTLKPHKCVRAQKCETPKLQEAFTHYSLQHYAHYSGSQIKVPVQFPQY